MLIDRLSIENFRSISFARLDLAHVNVFFGPMGAGKTSVRAAIEYAVMGVNEWTDAKGGGIKDQIRHHADVARVALNVGKREIERSAPGVSGRQQGALLFQAMGMTGTTASMEARVEACLRACNLLDRPDAEQKGIICGALRLNLDTDTFYPIVNALDERWPDLGEWFDGQLADRQSGIVKIDLELFAKFAREQRQADKRLREDLARRVEDLARKTTSRPDAGPEVAAMTNAKRDEIMRRLAELDAAEAPAVESYRAQHAAWKAQSDALTQAKRIMAEARERAHRALEKAEQTLSEVTDKLFGLSAPKRQPIEIEREKMKVAEEILTLEGDANRLEIEGRVTLETSFDRECQPGQCRAKQLIEQRRAIADKQRQASEMRAKAREKQKEKDVLQNEIEKAYLWGQVNAHLPAAEERLQEANEVLQSAIAAEDQQVGPETADPEPQPPARDAATRRTLEAELAEMSRQVELATALSHQAQLVDLQREELDAERTLFEQVAEDCERWELLVRAFEPSKDSASIPTKLLKDGLFEFEADVNAACEQNFPFGLEIEVEPWGIYLRKPTGLVRQRLASGGERVLLSAVMQIELAIRAGFPLIMLDEVQRVDALQRGPLLRYLQAQTDVQSLLFMAAQDKDSATTFRRPPVPKSPDLAYFWVCDGSIERMKP